MLFLLLVKASLKESYEKIRSATKKNEVKSLKKLLKTAKAREAYSTLKYYLKRTTNRPDWLLDVLSEHPYLGNGRADKLDEDHLINNILARVGIFKKLIKTYCKENAALITGHMTRLETAVKAICGGEVSMSERAARKRLDYLRRHLIALASLFDDLPELTTYRALSKQIVINVEDLISRFDPSVLQGSPVDEDTSGIEEKSQSEEVSDEQSEAGEPEKSSMATQTKLDAASVGAQVNLPKPGGVSVATQTAGKATPAKKPKKQDKAKKPKEKGSRKQKVTLASMGIQTALTVGGLTDQSRALESKDSTIATLKKLLQKRKVARPNLDSIHAHRVNALSERLSYAIQLVSSYRKALLAEEKTWFYFLNFFHWSRHAVKLKYADALIEQLSEQKQGLLHNSHLPDVIERAHYRAFASVDFNPEVMAGGSFLGTSRLLTTQRLLGVENAWRQGKARFAFFQTKIDFYGVKQSKVLGEGIKHTVDQFYQLNADDPKAESAFREVAGSVLTP